MNPIFDNSRSPNKTPTKFTSTHCFFGEAPTLILTPLKPKEKDLDSSLINDSYT